MGVPVVNVIVGRAVLAGLLSAGLPEKWYFRGG